MPCKALESYKNIDNGEVCILLFGEPLCASLCGKCHVKHEVQDGWEMSFFMYVHTHHMCIPPISTGTAFYAESQSGEMGTDLWVPLVQHQHFIRATQSRLPTSRWLFKISKDETEQSLWAKRVVI